MVRLSSSTYLHDLIRAVLTLPGDDSAGQQTCIALADACRSADKSDILGTRKI
jgi:hypothetical protein